MKRTTLVVVLATCAAGCGGSSTSPSPTPSPSPSPPSPTAATGADLAFCVSETNRYRTAVGRPALAESPALETYAAAGAQADAASHVPHGHFTSTCCSVALAENEVLTWPLALFGTVQEAMRQAIGGFYAEGPTGGHYQNLEGPYSYVGCGVYIAAGAITIVQDFR